jgi:hypothetical protein
LSFNMNASEVRRIVNDWHRELPGFSVYKPRHLLRRIGPLLMGVLLERDSGGQSYQPVFHVHCLAVEAPVIFLTMFSELRTERTKAPESIQCRFHDQLYLNAVERFKRQTPLPLLGTLSVDQVVTAYEAEIRNPERRGTVEVCYVEMMAVLVWCGQGERAREVLERWRRSNRGIFGWTKQDCSKEYAQCEEWMRDPAIIRRTVESEIKKFKLERVAATDFGA